MVPTAVARPIPAILAGYVTRIVMVDGVPARNLYRRLPDGESELVVHYAPGGSTASWIGTRSRVLRKAGEHAGSFLLVRFGVASAYPFFAGPASELTDEVVPLHALWRQDAEALAQAADAHGLERSLLDVLATRRAAAQEPTSARRIRAAIRGLAASARLPTVGQLANELGASERQLRRSFDELVGMSPKRFLRTLRFQRALSIARSSPRPDWAAVASQAGYFDQAHMIADFRELAGTSPTRLVTRTPVAPGGPASSDEPASTRGLRFTRDG